MTVASGDPVAGDPATWASRRRLAFWVWMSGIASIVGGAALMQESSAGGAVVGSLGVILCVIGRYLRVTTEQREHRGS
jgi:uncharacterized membrane protein